MMLGRRSSDSCVTTKLEMIQLIAAGSVATPYRTLKFVIADDKYVAMIIIMKNSVACHLRFLIISSFTMLYSLNRNQLSGFRSINAVNVAFSKLDRKSTRLNSSHVAISYAVFCF